MSLVDYRRTLAADGRLVVSPKGRLVVSVPLGERHHRVRIQRLGAWVRVLGWVAGLSSLEERISVTRLLDLLTHANGESEQFSLMRSEGWLALVCDLPGSATPEEVVEAVWETARRADRLERVWAGVDEQ